MTMTEKTRSTTRDLPVDMTPEEIAGVKDRALAELTEILDLQFEAKDVAAGYRARIVIATKELNALRESVASGTAQRSVQCREDFHPAEGVVKVYRLDRNKCFETRPMTAEDRQDDIEDGVEAGRGGK